MNFYIKQHSMMPVLTVELLEDGISTYQKIYERLENSTVRFFMEEQGSCIPILQCRECCLLVDSDCADCHDKIYIQYKWAAGDTAKKGKFIGWFEITFLDDQTEFIVPIKEPLYITVL